MGNGLGTRYFDDDWLLSGMGERKKTHFNDLIDSAIFIKENELALEIRNKIKTSNEQTQNC